MERPKFNNHFAEKLIPHVRMLVHQEVEASSGASPKFQDAYTAVYALSVEKCAGNAGEWILSELEDFLGGDEVKDTILRAAEVLRPSAVQPGLRWLQILYCRLCRLSTVLSSTFTYPMRLSGGRSPPWSAMTGEPLWGHLRVAVDGHMCSLRAELKWNEHQLLHFLMESCAGRTPLLPESLLSMCALQEQEVPAWWYGSRDDADCGCANQCSSLYVKLRSDEFTVVRVPTDPSIGTCDGLSQRVLVP